MYTSEVPAEVQTGDIASRLFRRGLRGDLICCILRRQGSMSKASIYTHTSPSRKKDYTVETVGGRQSHRDPEGHDLTPAKT